MRVAIIGCGPAGLAAAHAAFGLGADVTIYGPMTKSPQRGPLLLQRPIPGINNSHPKGFIKQIVIGGSILDYRYKLYGDINININGDILAEGYHAWDHFETYDELWRRYVETVPLPHGITLVKSLITSEQLLHLSESAVYDLVVNTAPLPDMCTRRGLHDFFSKRVAITTKSSYPNQPDDTIIFNARSDVPWVRSSRVFGHECTEWPTGSAPMESVVIRKPINTNCECFPRVLLTGRFGAWRNETWVDTAYWDTRNAIISRERKEIWDVVK